MPKATTKLIGKAPAFRKALDDASVAAKQDAPVLIYGETGAGKGILAAQIHKQSGRPGRLVSLNCATFQANLFESELFGHMRGSFTGAVKDTAGLFEAAAGGTLFLDEIGDTPLEIQPKLLRAVEEGVIRRVGGTREIPIDVKLVCATNHDLKKLIVEGKFREDLYYRVNSFVVNLPPLRDRQQDIVPLAESFLAELGSETRALAIETIEAMHAYSWPGNVRELRSAMAFAAAQAGERNTIIRTDLPATMQAADTDPLDSDGADYINAFRELYRTGAEDARLWAEFLHQFHVHLGSNKFARHDVLICLRAVRGPEPTNNALVNEWQRHIKPVPLRMGLIHEEGKKLRIELEACARALAEDEPEREEITESAIEPPPPLAQRDLRTNLGSSRTSFIGRQREVAELVEMVVAGKPNLITISGPGGTGKTRLSREVGRALAGELKGGAWFADLTESRNVEGVAYAVAQALGVPLTGNQSPELAVATMLGTRPRTLLILDNFEQVAEVASSLVGDWVSAAPQVSFLVTSRALLGVEGEQEFELQALPLPDESAPLATINRAESVRLFVERARVHHAGFALDEKTAPAVARICKRLEGMPLAIELAAARTVIMQPEQIADRLEKLFDILKSTRRDLQPRQRSLDATLDWSFDLLSEVEQWAFGQLSVFRGGFFLDAAEQILDLSRFPDAPAPMDLIQSLREKSLLRAFDTPYETRFNMYLLIREYALKRWNEMASDTEREAVATRFAEYFRRYGAEWTKRVYTSDALEGLDRLDYSRANLLAAMNWAAERAEQPNCVEMAFEIANELQHLYRVRGPGNERVSILRRALAIADGADSAARARLLSNLSQAESETGDATLSRSLAQDAIALSERVGDEMQIATSKFQMAGIEYSEGNVERAQELHEEVLPVFVRLGNDQNAGRVLTRMALMHAALGDFEAAIARSHESEEILNRANDLTGVGFALSIRASVFMKCGDNVRALEAVTASEHIYRELSDKRMIALSLGNRSLICRRLRKLEEALEVAKHCDELVRELGDRRMLANFQMNLGLLYIELDDLDNAERTFKECRALAATQQSAGIESVCVENLGTIEAARGNLARAHSLLDEAEMLANGDDSQRAGVGVSRAEVLLAEGRNDEAFKAVEPGFNYLSSQPAHEGRDWFRALLVRAQTASGEVAAEAAAKASALADRLNYRPDDRSPFIREALQILKKVRIS